MKVEKGISINDWALPLHIFAGKPYTDDNSRWMTQVVISFFCFYLAVEW